MNYKMLFGLILIFFCSCSRHEKMELGWKKDYNDFVLYLKENTDSLDINVQLSHFPDMKCGKDYWKGSVSPLFGIFNSSGVYYLEASSRSAINEILALYTFIDSVCYFSENAFRYENCIINDISDSVRLDVLNKYPVPTFYSGLTDGIDENCVKWKSEVEEKNLPYSKAVGSVPNDLKFYIIEGRNGNFWRKGELSSNIEWLNDWQNGYSRGIAISSEYNYICYWFMIW